MCKASLVSPVAAKDMHCAYSMSRMSATKSRIQHIWTLLIFKILMKSLMLGPQFRHPEKLGFAKNETGKWTCPICQTSVLMGSKGHHIRTRHPDVPFDQFTVEAPATVAVSWDMPPEQRDWVCPLCYGSLPELPSQALKRAKRAHVAERHPGVTLTQLHNLRSTGRPKKTNGVSKLQRKRHDERRQKVFSGHSLVQVTPPERVARGFGVPCTTAKSVFRC